MEAKENNLSILVLTLIIIYTLFLFSGKLYLCHLNKKEQ